MSGLIYFAFVVTWCPVEVTLLLNVVLHPVSVNSKDLNCSTLFNDANIVQCLCCNCIRASDDVKTF